MLSQDHLCSLFDYDEASGMLHWKVGRRRGKPAGCLDTDGYHRVKINRRMYPAHRVVFTLLKGCWPVGQIDHINGDKAETGV